MHPRKKKIDTETKSEVPKQSKKTVVKKEIGLILFLLVVLTSVSLAVWWSLNQAKDKQIKPNIATQQKTTKSEKGNGGKTKGISNDQKNTKPAVAKSNANIQEYESCLNSTKNEGDCKDCCDCLGADVEIRKECRDNCPSNDFSLNTEFTDFNIPSSLGKDGDYSACTTLSSEQDCKQCCDSSESFACGDFQYCRTACVK